MGELSGQWVGKLEGTNEGVFALALEHSADRVYGGRRFYESSQGSYEYQIQGVVSLPDVFLTLTPPPNQGVNLGRVEVRAQLTPKGALAGTWTSTIGTNGSFLCERAKEDVVVSATPTADAVFLIHGQDELTKEKVARFIESLGIETIILHEQINKSMTILEKFEEYSRKAKFAVALFTPDDSGHPVGKEEQKKSRARQNVVMELGYFIGLLGRENVAVLYRGDVELPSDMLGIVGTALDEHDGWRLALAKELKESGYDIDLNKLIA